MSQQPSIETVQKARQADELLWTIYQAEADPDFRDYLSYTRWLCLKLIEKEAK